MTKKVLSIILAAILLCGALPLTVFAEEDDVADTAAEEEIADTGEVVVVNIYNAYQLRTHLEANMPDDRILKLVLVNDITDYVGTNDPVTFPNPLYFPYEELNGDSNLVPVWCTVGNGKKVLDLNNHNVFLTSCYSAIYDGYDRGKAYCERKSNEYLFSIPAGADLIVNGGGTSDTYTGSIVYDGMILYRCDCIDQRDIFHVDGGSLTINSGRFAPANNYWYYDDNYPFVTCQQINGTAITVNKGELTVNGGYFEGRGMNSYTFKYSDRIWDIIYPARNGALEINGGKITVNDGHFVGVGSGSAVIDTSFGKADLHYNSGLFTVAYDHQWYAVSHTEDAPKYYDGGIVGIKLDALDPDTNYYIAPYDPITNAAEITDISDLRYRNTDLQPVDFYIRPKTMSDSAAGAPLADNKQIEFVRGSTPVEGFEDWNTKTENVLDVDPATLYFPIIDNTYASDDGHGNKQIRQTLNATISVNEYISEGNLPVIDTGINYTAKKSSDDPTDTWQIDLNEAIPASTLSKLQGGHNYVICFSFREILTSQDRTQTVTHKGYYYFSVPKTTGSYSITGKAKSFLNESDKTTIIISKKSGDNYTFKGMKTISGNAAIYSIGGLTNGQYKLRVSKKNHVTREYNVTILLGSKTQDVQINPLGDVTGDGKVTNADYSRVNQHVCKTKLLTDYALLVGDVVGSKGVTNADLARINQHVCKTNLLW